MVSHVTKTDGETVWAGSYVLRDVQVITQNTTTSPPTVQATTVPTALPFTITAVPGAVGTYQINGSIPTVPPVPVQYVGMAYKLCDGTRGLEYVASDGTGEAVASKIDIDLNVLRATTTKTFMNFNDTTNGIYRGRLERVLL